MPLTPREVADHDARHRAEPPEITVPAPPPSPLFRWERTTAPRPAGNVVAFRSAPEAPAPLAYAARAPHAVSAQTRAKLARLVREMKSAPPSRHV